MAVTHKAEETTLGPDLIFAQAETTQDDVALIQRWVTYQAERMAAHRQRVKILPLCTDSEGHLSRSGYGVGQLHILLDGIRSTQPLTRINLRINGPLGNVTSRLGSPDHSNMLFKGIEWARRVTLESGPACLRSREKDPAGSFYCAYRCPWIPIMRSRI